MVLARQRLPIVFFIFFQVETGSFSCPAAFVLQDSPLALPTLNCALSDSKSLQCHMQTSVTGDTKVFSKFGKVVRLKAWHVGDIARKDPSTDQTFGERSRRRDSPTILTIHDTQLDGPRLLQIRLLGLQCRSWNRLGRIWTVLPWCRCSLDEKNQSVISNL